MGCAPSAEKTKNDAIDKELELEKTKYDQEIKLLLLGSGESGKSTIAKQMKVIHLNGFTDVERSSFKVAIYNNVVTCMRALVTATQELSIEVAAEESANFVMRPEYEMVQSLPGDMVGHVKALWQDHGIKAAFARSSEFQLLDCAQYFFENIDKVAAADYVPDTKDILACRTKTTGATEVDFTVSKTHFRLVDVGGQRSERKKWMNCFPDVTAVIFVVAMSEYDLKLYEDNTTNRMFESLKLFKEICNNKYFTNTAMILFFNKSDLFKQKLSKVDLSVCFPDYKDGDNYDQACVFLQDKFLSLNENPSKPVYVHFTCATDTENVQVVFNVVKDIIIRDLFSHKGGS